MQNSLMDYRGYLDGEMEPWNPVSESFWINIASLRDTAHITSVAAEFSDQPGYNVMDRKRRYLKHIKRPTGCDGDQPLLWFFCMYCDRPAELVIWAWTLELIRDQLGHHCTLVEFRDQFFPIGLPTDHAMYTAWQRQKCRPTEEHPGDNLLDCKKLWRQRFPDLTHTPTEKSPP